MPADPTRSVCPVMGSLVRDGACPVRIDGTTGLLSLYLALRRLGIGICFSEMLTVSSLVANGWRRLPANLLFMRTRLGGMAGGSLDRGAGTRILSQNGFDAAEFERLASYASDGESLSAEDVARLVADDAARTPSRLGHALALLSFALLLRVFGSGPAAPGERGLRLPIATLRSLYREQRLPPDWRPQRRTGCLSGMLAIRELVRAGRRLARDPGDARS